MPGYGKGGQGSEIDLNELAELIGAYLVITMKRS